MAMTRKTQSGSEKSIDFILTWPNASKVMLAGTFNNWNYRTAAMKKQKDNTWRKTLSLKPGRYEYKYVVDGRWIMDPNNNNRARNSVGSENSVIEVK